MKKANTTNIIKLAILEVILLLIAAITYKTMINPEINNKITAGLTWDHKVNYDYVLSADNPVLSEIITLDVPELKNIYISGRINEEIPDADNTTPQPDNNNIEEDAQLLIKLTQKDNGQVLLEKTVDVSSTFPTGMTEEDALPLKLKIKESEHADSTTYILNIQLINATDTQLVLTSNYKPGIVESFNEDTNNKTNVITEIRYASVHRIRFIYAIILLIMMLFVAVSYYLINIKGYTVTRFYMPLMIILGIAYQIMIPVGGTPDESWHLDTAYKYSDIIMFSGDTGNAGTIYKRTCDVVQSDMLGNNIETNSYYQLYTNAFTRPDNTQLIEVQYIDASNQVPGIVYIPAAIGISIGRLLGLSAMLTYTLGRFIPLLFYAVIIWLALRLLPYGQNVMALVSLLPISIQQAGSTSYDCVIICSICLFIAIILHILDSDTHNKWLALAAALLAGLIAISKGGAYLPVILIALAVPYKRKKKKENAKLTAKLAPRTKILISIGIIAILAILLALTYGKFSNIYTSMNDAARNDGSTANMHYTINYLIMNPKVLFAIMWNTVIIQFDSYLTGLLGGSLGWNSLKVGFIYVLPFLIVLLLMASSDTDRIRESVQIKIMLLIPCILSVLLILAGLLVGYTEMGQIYIQGVQGRYFLPYAALLFMLTSNSMVRVDDNRLASLWNVVTITEFIFVVRCLTITMG